AANLAEAAAEAVGANPVLARVGCYFHDIGKIRRPHFFVENQADIGNIHENLSPTTSSDILNAHVTEGVELLKQYHFPTTIREIVQQHQGTTVKRYFYRQALEQGLDVREDDFRYPGPRPRQGRGRRRYDGWGTRRDAGCRGQDDPLASTRAEAPSQPVLIRRTSRRARYRARSAR